MQKENTMRTRHIALCLAIAGVVAACEDAPETQTEELRWTSQEQLHRENGTATQPRPALGPEQQLQQFFEALRNRQIEQAAALVSDKSREAGHQEVVESLRQWAGGPAAQQEFEVIDSQQASDFALVRARLMPPDNTQAQPAIRPVIMFREEGQWRVVWDLLGMLPEQAAQFEPQIAQQLEPLYNWYSQQQRTQIGQTGADEERTGGSPAADQALARQAQQGQAQQGQAQQGQAQQGQAQQGQTQQGQTQQGQTQQGQTQQGQQSGATAGQPQS
jgi:hypothetical protein